jgi:predicted permease
VLTGVLFGLAPALRGSQVNLNETLKEGGRAMGGSGNRRLRNLLVIAEIAVSLVLLISAGLLIRSFVRVQRVEPGFDANNVLSLRLSVIGTTYLKEPRRTLFYQQLWERIGRLPGVESVGGVSVLPLSGGVGWGSITIEGYDSASGQTSIQADGRSASVGYFETMKIPLVAGRFFSDQDTKESLQAAIIDEHMARTYWPGADPIGKRLKFGGSGSTEPWMTIVGVVGNVKHYALDADSRVTFYMPHQQSTSGTMYLTLRTTADPLSLSASVTQEARAMDPNVPVYDIKSMEQRLSDSFTGRRFAMFALGLFAAVAALLAAIGIYGVMSYTVAQRTREIGLRVALGAKTSDVLWLMVSEGMKLAGAGVGIGLAAALVVTRVMASLLFGVSATDPATFASVALLLAAVALLACFIPARRATRVDPMVALRYQ